MKRAPATDLYGNTFTAAKSEDVLSYLTAERFHNLPINSKFESVEVRASSLNVRSGPATSYSIVDSVKLNQTFEVIEESGNWFKIKLRNNATGWVSGDFVNATTKPTAIDNYTATVTASVLNVRSGPSTTYNVTSQVYSGNTFTVLDQQDGWVKISTSNSQGWISGEYISLDRSLDNGLLQFLKLSGSSGISVDDLNKELGKSGILSGLGHVFKEASEKYNINEIYLLGHSKLETGSGFSDLAKGILVEEVDGQAVEPKVVYNMFGIGAFDSSPVKSGSEYAYKMGWDTVEASIIGGAEWISERYVNNSTHKQDTLYKMRWNPVNPGNHQYATDIGWAYKQTHTLNQLIEFSNKYDLQLRFDIPIYK